MRANERLEAVFRLLFQSPTLPVAPVIDRGGFTAASFGKSEIGEACVYNGVTYTDRRAFMQEYYAANRKAIKNKFGDDNNDSEIAKTIDAYLEEVALMAFRPVIVVHISEGTDGVPQELLFDGREE